MKLDKRIKSKEDILTCFDIEKAGQFLGHKGYFANVNSSYQNLDNKAYGILTEIKDAAYSFKMDNNEYWRFFIPEIILKPKEKKYRPFTIYEFEDEYFDIVVFRKKKGNVELHSRYNGYSFSKERGADVLLGCEYFSFEELFNNYELQDSDGNWQPFGVEE